jgi:hypothetical protein
VEILTVVAVFTLLVAAMVATQLFGMRMYSLSQTRLTLTANARNVLNRVRDDVRSGQIVVVGNADQSSFNSISNNTARTGNALKICADSSNTNNYVYYYLDTTHSSLNRITSSNTNQIEVIANNITNQIVFQAQDYMGNVLTNDQNNEVIDVLLQLRQWECPVAVSTNRSMYGCYQLETRVSPRVY